jgi:hypothetical protein
VGLVSVVEQKVVAREAGKFSRAPKLSAALAPILFT